MENVVDVNQLIISGYDQNMDAIFDFIRSIVFNPNASTIPGCVSLSCRTNPTDRVLYVIEGATAFPGMDMLPSGPADFFQISVMYVSGDTGAIFGPSGCTEVTICFARTGDKGDPVILAQLDPPVYSI